MPLFARTPDGPDADGRRRGALRRALPGVQPHRRDRPGHPQRQPHQARDARLHPRLRLAVADAADGRLLAPLPGDQRRPPDLRRRPGVPARRGRPAHPLRLRRLAGRDLGAADDRHDLSDRQPRRSPASTPGCAAADIPELPLLHVDWADAEWTGWDELLRRAGIPHGALPGRRFSTLGVVLQACQEDQGVAVGWHRLVRPLIEEGRIVPFTDLRIPAPGSYYLSWNANHAPGDAVATLRDWLLAGGRREPTDRANRRRR